jgi:copper chaperone
MTTATFRIEGMSCGHCQAAVTKALRGVPGVVHAEVSLEKGEATVTYDPAQVGAKELEASVDEAGYRLVSL